MGTWVESVTSGVPPYPVHLGCYSSSVEPRFNVSAVGRAVVSFPYVSRSLLPQVSRCYAAIFSRFPRWSH